MFLLQQGLYTRRSEWLLVAQLVYNLLFRWFGRLAIDDTVWHPTAFTKNGDGFLTSVVPRAFLAVVLIQSPIKALLSVEKFSTDGTLIEARAALKGFGARDDDSRPTGRRDRARDLPGERRRNATQASATAPEARLYLIGYVFIENRHGLGVDTRSTGASGTAGARGGSRPSQRSREVPRMTVGADKTYRHGRRVRVSALRSFNVTTNVATSRRSAIDGGILRHPGYYRAGDRCLGALGFQRSRSGQQPSQSSGCPSCSRWANELDA